jgi:hypothetical protein
LLTHQLSVLLTSRLNVNLYFICYFIADQIWGSFFMEVTFFDPFFLGLHELFMFSIFLTLWFPHLFAHFSMFIHYSENVAVMF